MRISESCVVVRPNQLSLDTLTQLKDGQQILAKIINVTSDKALLDIAGNTVQARNEGTQLTAGTVSLFTVKLGNDGQIELKILATLNENGNGANLAPSVGNQLLVAALNEEGLPSTPDNLQILNRLLSEIQLKFNVLPSPKVVAFLMARDLPLTLENLVMAWVQTDRKLRDYWWNQLEQAGRLDLKTIMAFSKDTNQIFKWLMGKENPCLIKEPQTAKTLIDGQVFRGETMLSRSGENINQTEAAGRMTPRDELQKITELLTHRTNEEQVRGENPGGEDYYGNVPLLVRDSKDRVHELVIRCDKEANGRQTVTSGQTLRLVIPTDHLGDISVIMSQNAGSTKIHFEVESDEVKDYLWDEIDHLREMTGSKIKIGIKVTQRPVTAGGMDFWM